MRTLMLIYLWAVYIVSLPIALLAVIGIIVWDAIYCIKERLEFDDFKDGIKALWDGIKEGHAINMCRVNELRKD